MRNVSEQVKNADNSRTKKLFPFIVAAGVIVVISIAFLGSVRIRYIVKDGDTTLNISSYERDVGKMLADNNIDTEYADYTAEKDGKFTVVTIDRYRLVTVKYDGIESAVMMAKCTVSDLLDGLGIVLGDDDTVSFPGDTEIEDGMEITIHRVRTERTVVEAMVSYSVTYETSDVLYEGDTQTKIAGENGVEELTYIKTFVDDVLDDFQLENRKSIKDPVDEVVVLGTKVHEVIEEPAAASAPSSSGSSSSSGKSQSSGSSSSSGKSQSSGSSSSSGKTGENSAVSQPVSQKSSKSETKSSSDGGTVTTLSGETYSYSKVLNMTATAYTYNSGKNITSSGVPAQVGVVAALKTTLEPGTRVYIVSPTGSWEYGVATVGDTPGMDIIDLFMETYDECIQFGMRDALVYVLS